MGSLYKKSAAVVLLVAAPLLLYLRVKDFGLIIYDDYAVIDFIRHFGGCNFSGLLAAFTGGPACFPYKVPVTTLSYTLSQCLWADDISKQHLVNLFFHIANTFLLFCLLASISRAFWKSFFVAVLFAVHPMNSGFVIPLSGRTSLLSSFFFFLSVIAYTRRVKNRPAGANLPAMLLFLVALGAKPDIIHLPFILLLLNYWPLKRFAPGLPEGHHAAGSSSTGRGRLLFKSLWPLVKETAPFFIVAFAWSVIALFLYSLSPKYGKIDLSLLTKELVNAPVSYIMYLWDAVAPFNLYSFNRPRLESVLPWWQIGTTFFLFAVITVLVLTAGRRHRYLAVGWLWFVIAITPPVLVDIFRSEITANRYLYLPGIGLFIIFVWGGADLIRQMRYKPLGRILFAVWLSALLLLAWRQVGYHRDHSTFYARLHGIVHGYDRKMLNQLALYWLSTGRYKETIAYFSKEAAASPDNPHVYYNLGLAFAKTGKPEKALAAYRQALSIYPDYASAHNNIANILIDLGQIDAAIEHYKRALDINPRQPEVYNNLATALARKGEVSQAVDCLKKALVINPDYSIARENLGRLLSPMRRAGVVTGDVPP